MRKKLDYKHLIEDVCGFMHDSNDDTFNRPKPSMTAQQALNELCNYFLGEDWYEPTGQTHPEVVNFSIVEHIERNYKGAKIHRNKQ